MNHYIAIYYYIAIIILLHWHI